MPILNVVLHAQIRVDYLQSAISGDGLIKNCYRIPRIKRVVSLSANYIMTIDINDGTRYLASLTPLLMLLSSYTVLNHIRVISQLEIFFLTWHPSPLR